MEDPNLGAFRTSALPGLRRTTWVGVSDAVAGPHYTRERNRTRPATLAGWCPADFVLVRVSPATMGALFKGCATTESGPSPTDSGRGLWYPSAAPERVSLCVSRRRPQYSSLTTIGSREREAASARRELLTAAHHKAATLAGMTAPSPPERLGDAKWPCWSEPDTGHHVGIESPRARDQSMGGHPTLARLHARALSPQGGSLQRQSSPAAARAPMSRGLVLTRDTDEGLRLTEHSNGHSGSNSSSSSSSSSPWMQGSRARAERGERRR